MFQDWICQAVSAAGTSASTIFEQQASGSGGGGISGASVTCSLCSKQFFGPNRQYVLNRHVQTIHGSLKPYNCSYCDYKAARKDHITRHEKMVHTLRTAASAVSRLLPALQSNSGSGDGTSQYFPLISLSEGGNYEK